MTTLTAVDRNLDKNVSIVPTDVLMEWSKIIDNTMHSLNYSDENENLGIFKIEDETSYDKELNQLYAYMKDPSGNLIDIEMFLDDNNGYFELYINEGSDHIYVQNTPYHGGCDINEGLFDMLYSLLSDYLV